MLREVVVAGTGKRAQLDGYSSAGKTGTAWKFDPAIKGINRSKYISSFIGFAPADNPAITIAVVMDEPKLGGRDGGGAAAPAFQEIAQTILPELKVARDIESNATVAEIEEDIPETPGADGADTLKQAPQTGGPKLNDGETGHHPKGAMPKNESGKRPAEKTATPNSPKPVDTKPKRSIENEKVADPSNRQIKNKSSSARMDYRT
jgi:membrane peptidoglycan carboxypeptidase